MKMSGCLIVFFLLSWMVVPTYGQTDLVQELVEQGVAKHDSGRYREAIALYQKALRLQPHSSVANYEIAFSYMMVGDYRSAVKFSRKVIRFNDDSQLGAYITCGSALDMMGKTDRSVRVYERAMKKYDYYLLYYNHAVSCFVGGKPKKACESAIKAIRDNPAHASSHLLLSKIMARKGERVKAMLPLYFFLLLEPDTPRAATAYESLRKYMDRGINEKPGEKDLASGRALEDPGFRRAERLLNQAGARQEPEKAGVETGLPHFAAINQELFKGLGEIRGTHAGFWWDFYVTFFSEMADKGLTEVYSYYISQSQGSEATEWFDWHNDNYERFKIWLSLK